MKPTALAALLLLLGICMNCFAQADFRFYVFDETKTDKLHYEFCQDVTIYNFESSEPRLVYSTEYRIYGINQDAFTFTTQSYDGDLTRKEYAAILDLARKLPTSGLDATKNNKGAAGSHGWLTLDRKNHTVKATPDTEVRQRWQKFLDALVAEHVPARKRKTTRRTLEGETVAPREIDFATLLKNPKACDGKRIRLTGYYHGEFECSSLAATKEHIRNYKQALWVGGSSSFADPKRISGRNNRMLTVDGTFELGPGGHMGLWMGELSRITEAQPLKKR